MALVEKIRTKAGNTFLLLTVFFLIVMLLSSDLERTLSHFFGRKQDQIGTLDGRPISYSDYHKYLTAVHRSFEAEGKQPTAEEKKRLKTYAWRQLIEDMRYAGATKKAGITVGSKELVDLVQGEHVDARIKASFQNPETKAFDKQKLRNYLRNLTKEAQVGWCAFEQNLAAQRAKEKLHILMQKSYFVTDLETEQVALHTKETCDVDYLYIPFTTIPNNLVVPTNQQLKDYMVAHSDRYKSPEHMFRIAYVSFPIEPSKEDKARFQDTVHALTASFAAASDAHTFAKQHTDGPITDAYVECPVSNLPSALEACKHALKTGMLIGPTVPQKGTVYLYKVIDIAKKEGMDWYKIAMIEKRMLVGQDTRNQLAKVAKQFAAKVAKTKAAADFETATTSANKVVHKGEVHPASESIGYHQMAREVVRWVFHEASVGKVSDPFDVGDAYLVVYITEQIKKGGLVPLESVHNEVYQKVKNEAASKIIVDKLNQIPSTTLEDIAAQYGTNAVVRSVKGLKFLQTDDQLLRVSPVFVGQCFGLPIGTISSPIVDQTGVFVTCVRNKQIDPDTNSDAKQPNERMGELERWMQSYYISQAMEELIELTDERYKFQ